MIFSTNMGSTRARGPCIMCSKTSYVLCQVLHDILCAVLQDILYAVLHDILYAVLHDILCDICCVVQSIIRPYAPSLRTKLLSVRTNLFCMRTNLLKCAQRQDHIVPESWPVVFAVQCVTAEMLKRELQRSALQSLAV